VTRRRLAVIVVVVVVVAGGATAAYAALSSGPTGGCMNPLATHYSNQQQSMGPTLAVGDLILVDTVPAGTPFTRGEIVVFTAPGNFAGSAQLIKRIVGLPGETISIHDGRVFVNGTALDEPYLAQGTVTDPQGDQSGWTLGAADLFVLGDSRANSADSRSFGPVPVASVTGRAAAICSPDSRRTALP
jgi:signal peptidase I